MTDAGEARRDWEQRIGRVSDVATASRAPHLAAPTHVRADAGQGQVTLSWQPVDDAIGYVVLAADAPDAEFLPIDTGNPDVIAVPAPPFADTTGTPGVERWYRIAAIPSAGTGPGDPGPMGDASAPVSATPMDTASARVRVQVHASRHLGPLERPWRPMIGSEHLSQLFYGTGPAGHDIGSEFAEALRIAHDELGVRAVRAHAILDDELRVYREVAGQPVHDFTGIDRVYDRLLEIGLRPIVELSFMPRDLARDPDATVFEYGAIISPPRDWGRWDQLIEDLVRHLVARYGLDEVRGWAFEVWNEANLEVFWSGTLDEYLRLYDVTAAAVKRVDSSLTVGGPASAADGWLDELLAHCADSHAAVDFVSTHTYGNYPLDLRPLLARHGFGGRPAWWTEWGVNASHFGGLHDTPYAAAFLVGGMSSAMGRIDALSYWTVSDHFEELGRPPRLLHGGFGLLTVGNLRKPRYWALWMLESLADGRIAVSIDGDGAWSLVNALATRDDDGTVRLLVWNTTIDHGKASPDPLLIRSISLHVDGLANGAWTVRHWRVDDTHSNLARRWQQLAGSADWPTTAQWQQLRDEDRLDELVPAQSIDAVDEQLSVAFELPLPAISLLELCRPGAGNLAAR